MKRIYTLVLKVYPRDFKAAFAPEMINAFDRATEECRRPGRSYARFVSAEVAGLLAGAAAEWFAKLTTDAAVRGRCIPDRLLMRPPGVSWDAHYGYFDSRSHRRGAR